MYFYSANEYYKSRFGGKAYKISLSSGMSCPNRDGTLSKDGCIFCSETGSGDFSPESTLSIDELTEKSKRLPLLKDELDEKSLRWLELSEIEN